MEECDVDLGDGLAAVDSSAVGAVFIGNTSLLRFLMDLINRVTIMNRIYCFSTHFPSVVVCQKVRQNTPPI